MRRNRQRRKRVAVHEKDYGVGFRGQSGIVEVIASIVAGPSFAAAKVRFGNRDGCLEKFAACLILERCTGTLLLLLPTVCNAQSSAIFQ